MQVNNSYYTAAYSQIASYQASFSVSGSYLDLTGGTNAVSTDGVDVSDVAKQLADKIKELDIFKLIYPNNDVRKDAKSLDDIAGEFKNDFSSFSNMFSQMTSMMGMTGSFTMGLNGTGGMTVSGTDEASAAKLQESFSGNQTITARFAVMAARAALVDARSTVDGFDSAYSQDPFAAITDNIDALKERLLGFRAQGGNGSMSYGFMRSFSATIEFAYSAASTAGGAAEETAETTETPEAEAVETTPAEVA